MLLFITSFRRKALRVRTLVELHFDPVHGWPKDPSVMTEEEVSMLTGGKRTWKLDYAYLNKLPSFIGLYVGNMIVAICFHWVCWMVILYVVFCPGLPNDLTVLYVLMFPIIVEGILKSLLWKSIISEQHGILHIRIYALVDVLLSMTSAVTGLIKTVLRVVGGVVCLLAHLFRSDVTMMLDKSFYSLDPHYTSSTALLTALRIQYEFSKIRRERPEPAGTLCITVKQANSLIAADSNTSDPYVKITVGAHTAATTVVSKSLNPVWGSGNELSFLVYDRKQILDISVLDHDAASAHDEIGSSSDLSIEELLDDSSYARTVQLGEGQGTLTFEVQWTPGAGFAEEQVTANPLSQSHRVATASRSTSGSSSRRPSGNHSSGGGNIHAQKQQQQQQQHQHQHQHQQQHQQVSEMSMPHLNNTSSSPHPLGGRHASSPRRLEEVRLGRQVSSAGQTTMTTPPPLNRLSRQVSSAGQTTAAAPPPLNSLKRSPSARGSPKPLGVTSTAPAAATVPAPWVERFSQQHARPYLLRRILLYKPKDLNHDWSPRFSTLWDKNSWI
jgi:hypothetical protein